MRWDIYGPLVFWSVMFLIGASIQYVTFNKGGVFYNLPSDLALWATGIMFSICVSEPALNQAKLTPNYKKHQNGRGFSVDYDITLPEEINSTPKLTYFFLICIAIWIGSILLSGTSQASIAAITPATTTLQLVAFYSGLSLSYFLSFFSVGLALYTLREAAQ